MSDYKIRCTRLLGVSKDCVKKLANQTHNCIEVKVRNEVQKETQGGQEIRTVLSSLDDKDAFEYFPTVNN